MGRGRGGCRWRNGEQRELGRLLVEPAHLRADDLDEPLRRAARERGVVCPLGAAAKPFDQITIGWGFAVDLQTDIGQLLE